jgi:uncharacterized protein YjdB
LAAHFFSFLINKGDTMNRVQKIAVGATYQCMPAFRDQNGQPMRPTALGPTTYASDTPAVATVDAGGKVTAVSAGSANITATNGALQTTVTFSVYAPVATKILM